MIYVLSSLNIDKQQFFHEKISNVPNDVKFRRNHIAEIIGNSMFIHGGIDDKEDKLLNDFWLLDLDRMKWISVEFKGYQPPPLAYHSSSLVVTSDKRLNTNFHIYKFPEAPTRLGRKRVKNEGVYLYGGIDGEKRVRSELRVLKIGTRPVIWTTIKTFGKPPGPRHSCSLDYFEDLNVLFLYGGSNDSQLISNEVFLLDLEHYNWSLVSIFDVSPYARAEHSSCLNGNSLLIFGGINMDMYLGSELYIINLDIWEKKRRRYTHKSKHYVSNDLPFNIDKKYINH